MVSLSSDFQCHDSKDRPSLGLHNYEISSLTVPSNWNACSTAPQTCERCYPWKHGERKVCRRGRTSCSRYSVSHPCMLQLLTQDICWCFILTQFLPTCPFVILLFQLIYWFASFCISHLKVKEFLLHSYNMMPFLHTWLPII